jgi:indolepyruvate ferredoxin oxidoreductase
MAGDTQGTQSTSGGTVLPKDFGVSLDDKFDLSKQRIFMTGTQAVIRMMLMQHERDTLQGRNTAGFISGYRGSPLGALDQQLHRFRKPLDAAHIVFTPGINEELAATACWGTQQAEMRGEGKYDGVFSLWYGKGPGVDRSGDVFRHANMAGTSEWGGVLALMGDDHTAESSTTAHQSEFHFVDVMMPILNPAGVQEVLDYGLYGFAMSRYTGAWVALKGVKDTVESTAVVDGSIDRVTIRQPSDFAMPRGGLNIRPRDGILAMEERLQDYKRDAMLAFLRANPINRIVMSGGTAPRVGIITVGKSYLDVRQALDDLGIDEAQANSIGLRLYKIGCAWPLEPVGLAEFVRGLELVIVVEEKRSLIEVQLREELYGKPHQPVCIGKRDEQGEWLFPVKGALDPNDIGNGCCAFTRVRSCARGCSGSNNYRPICPRCRMWAAAFRISARAVRITPPQKCRKACALMRASGAITWCNGWIAKPRALPRWAVREPTGWANLLSPTAPMCSRI